MNYDLSDANSRKRFITRANALIASRALSVVLTDDSRRSPSQNKYLHTIIRILAIETGVTEQYAKDIYFKEMANRDLFVRSFTDPITKESAIYLKSSANLSKDEMTKAISRFRKWSEEQGYYLPDADMDEEGLMQFKTENDKKQYYRALSETDKCENFL